MSLRATEGSEAISRATVETPAFASATRVNVQYLANFFFVFSPALHQTQCGASVVSFVVQCFSEKSSDVSNR